MKVMKMNKYISQALVLLVGALVSVSCSNDSLEAGSEISDSQLTIIATHDKGTKTSLISGSGVKSVVWSPQDAISLFYESGDNGGSCFVTKDSGPVAQFTGTITSISGNLEEDSFSSLFWGVYPYETTASCDGTSIHTNLIVNQKGVPDTFADRTAVAVGRSNTLKISFKNANAIFAFKLERDDIRKVKMYGNNDEKIAGSFTITFDSNGNVISTPENDASTNVCVTPAQGSTFLPDTWYYIVTLPVFFSGGYSLEFETWSETGIYTTSEERNFEISTFYTLTKKDNDAVFTPKDPSLENPEGADDPEIPWI